MKIIWVSADEGSDFSGNGAQYTPYATIERALTDFVSGDQIRLLDGTYTPTDSVVISGMDGSLFSENPRGAKIQPQKTTLHQAGVAILEAERFTVQGIVILQAANSTGNFIGLYVENIENFVALTCEVSDFRVPSGIGYGIFAAGGGRIEGCDVSNFACGGIELYGIRTKGLDIIDCHTMEISGYGECNVTCFWADGLLGP
jgi:hypothetical protein